MQRTKQGIPTERKTESSIERKTAKPIGKIPDPTIIPSDYRPKLEPEPNDCLPIRQFQEYFERAVRINGHRNTQWEYYIFDTDQEKKFVTFKLTHSDTGKYIDGYQPQSQLQTQPQPQPQSQLQPEATIEENIAPANSDNALVAKCLDCHLKAGFWISIDGKCRAGDVSSSGLMKLPCLGRI
jgi:hypothetical protein